MHPSSHHIHLPNHSNIRENKPAAAPEEASLDSPSEAVAMETVAAEVDIANVGADTADNSPPFAGVEEGDNHMAELQEAVAAVVVGEDIAVVVEDIQSMGLVGKLPVGELGGSLGEEVDSIAAVAAAAAADIVDIPPAVAVEDMLDSGGDMLDSGEDMLDSAGDMTSLWEDISGWEEGIVDILHVPAVAVVHTVAPEVPLHFGDTEQLARQVISVGPPVERKWLEV